MWRTSIRDLQWRWRRFVIGVLAASMVFAVTLLMSGLADSLRHEATTTLRRLGGDTWVVADGGSGPFTSLSVFPQDVADTIRATPGVRAAAPVAIVHQTTQRPRRADLYLIGIPPGLLGQPTRLAAGRPVRAAGEAVVDRTLGYGVGQRFEINDRPFTVVGVGRHLTMNGGGPSAYVALSDVQALLLRGAPMATAVIVAGRPAAVPPGLRAMTRNEVRDDIIRLNVRVLKAMRIVRTLLWAVTAGIIGTLVYLSALERTRDFAVFKATGASSASLFGGLALQAGVISISAAALSVGIAHLLVPLFPVPVLVSGRAVALLPVVAVSIGLLASALSLRRAVAVDPALAFVAS